MTSQVIYLHHEDDIVSINDRLDWAGESRVLLVLPEQGDLLVEPLDLVLLRRKAQALRLEVGLVTHDSRVSGAARALGIPAFATVRAGQRRRSWWRARRRLALPPAPLHDDDRREAFRRGAAWPLWKRWLWRYAGIVFFFTVLALLLVALLYVLPSATVTLRPQVKPIQVTRQIVADPQLEGVSHSGASVPGRRLIVTSEWRSSVETTGLLEVPDAPGRGKVVFVNRQESAVTVPAGTRVSTTAADRIAFQVINPVEVPGTVGATVEADVVAVQPGPAGNVAAYLVNRIEGALALQLDVRNLEPIEGGGNRQVRAVSQADQERLRAQVLQQLQLLALAEMSSQLGPNEFLAQDSLRLASIRFETFSHFPGEQSDRLTLEMQADLQATAVDQSQAIGLVYEQLDVAAEPGFELVPESLHFQSGDVLGVDGQGRVSFEMKGEGLVAAQLSLEGPLAAIAGQPDEVALGYLYQQLPLRSLPTARIRPAWFKRLPYMPLRIQVLIDTGVATAQPGS